MVMAAVGSSFQLFVNMLHSANSGKGRFALNRSAAYFLMVLSIPSGWLLETLSAHIKWQPPHYHLFLFIFFLHIMHKGTEIYH